MRSVKSKVYYVGLSLMKFEELGILIHGEPINICPSNMEGFLPVFSSLEEAANAGWGKDSVRAIQLSD